MILSLHFPIFLPMSQGVCCVIYVHLRKVHAIPDPVKYHSGAKMEICCRAAFVLAMVFAVAAAGHAQDTIFPAIITFGDSGVDVGNNNHLQTYFRANYPPYGKDFINHVPTGRFCNGKLATDITAEIMGFKTHAPPYLSPEASGKNLLIGANFASAASGFDDETAILNGAIPLSKQLEYFKEYQTKLENEAGSNKSKEIIRDALYILSAGTADFFQNYYVNPELNRVYTPNQYGSYLVNAFSSFAKKLYSLGARKLGVTSLLPLGCIPEALRLVRYKEDGCVHSINNNAQQFNRKINVTTINLQKQLPGLKIVVFNIFKPFHDMIRSPANYGFAETRKGCCAIGTTGNMSVLCSPKSPRTCDNATQYIFWDNVHPSEAANQVLAEAMLIQGLSLT